MGTYHYMTKDELRKLLHQAVLHNFEDYLMILVMFSHGLRVSEVVNLRRKDIQDGYITVKRLKGSKKTVQPLVGSSETIFSEAAALRAWLTTITDPETILFPMHRMTVWRKIQKYGALAGIPKHKCHPHTLKHSIAKLSIKKAGIENVQQYLGHKSMNSTAQYLKSDDEEASSAVQGAL